MSNRPKYRPAGSVEIENRSWPAHRITTPPVWVSVDLRDGNQAFVKPMDVEAKLRYFRMLTEIGVKEIEVAYPSASTEEFEFVRRLIVEDRIPEDVRIVVFTALREDLIRRTMESIKGVRQATIHSYIASSDLHREFVFGKSEEELIRVAKEGTRMIREAVDAAGMAEKIHYQFSPEEFSDSRIDFVLRLASAVKEAWGPCRRGEFILNLPETVERRAPYEFADMIESFIRAWPYPEETIFSTHTHNDQGGAVAAAEMAVLAGAERVEGTLLGHGERTGNMDLVTFALNLKARGVDPGLDFSHLPEVTAFIEKVSGIKTYPRMPYAGELVFTAFSGTHQDAIRKGMAARGPIGDAFDQEWKMPYLHLDPADIGRNYEGLIRINSQSGKGGIAYVLESVYGISVPKAMQPSVGKRVQARAEESGAELTPEEVRRIFYAEFVDVPGRVKLGDFRIRRPAGADSVTGVELEMEVDGRPRRVTGTGAGPIEAATAAMARIPELADCALENYSEHALGTGADAEAIAYIAVLDKKSGRTAWGAGVHRSINLAAIRGIVSAINNLER